MRTPSLACALFAAAATLVSGAPLPSGSYNSDVFAASQPNSPSAPAHDATVPHTRPRIGIKEIRDALPDHQPQVWVEHTIAPRAFEADLDGGSYSGAVNDVDGSFVAGGPRNLERVKRTDDDGTLGGNAHSGNSGPVNGGDVVNQGDNFGMPTLMNMNSNNAGGGGASESGCAAGGRGNGDRGAGGNGYSGDSGEAQGGSVMNSGGVMNFDSNNAGTAGTSKTGCATGGDVTSNGQ